MRQNLRVIWKQKDDPTITLTWEFVVTYHNPCSLDAIGSWTTEAADIDYTLLNTYILAQTVTSTASVPVWDASLDA